MTLTRCATSVLVSLMMCGGVVSCARWPTNSGSRDSEVPEAARNELFAALRKWEANVRAKRAGTAAYPGPGGALTAGGMDTFETLSGAAQMGDAKLVKSLLARGASRKALNEALFAAASSEPLVEGPPGPIDLRYGQTARLLLKKGASIEARNEGEDTPLIAAAGQGETAVVKLLLEKGANIEATDSYGQTALIAAACNCPIIDMPDTDDSVRLLLENGANLEAKDKQGRTALMAAADWGRTSILQILLDKGAQIEARNNHGNTALLLASEGGGYPTADAVQLLLTRGADIEARNNNGDTALMLAASGRGFEDVKIVKMLLKRGADVRAEDNKGRTALNLAAGKDRTKIVSLLRGAMAKSH